MPRLFVTGAGGFAGRPLVRELLARGHAVSGLYRSGDAPPGVTAIRGELLESDQWRDALAASDAVLHLAAATGKAATAIHARVNAEGSRLIAEACREAGKPLLFVSSVAVSYPSHDRYPYAWSKARAEQTVRGAGIRFAIARPTIIAGPGSPVVAALRKLALLPVIPVFGGGQVKVQPVDVDDVALVLADIVDQDRFTGETIGIGGPEVVTMESFLQAIRRAAGKGAGPVVHLPLGAVLPLVGLGQSVAGGAMPVTVGQLAAFRFDGTVEPHPITEARRARMKTVAQMLAGSVS